MVNATDHDGIAGFQELIRDHYRKNGRRFPWRNVGDPYFVLLSELMLQQTQTSRALDKYPAFTARFPTIGDLAGAELGEVLRLWQGLGYNRRARYLHETAKIIVARYDGIVPDREDLLVPLPGIGPGTAGAIVAFAYDRPVVFLETNIRRVFLHLFFHDSMDVRDAEILPLIDRTLDRDHPREWYYALTDFGVYLKDKFPNPNRRSAHYKIQSRFENSNRQVRGAAIRFLSHSPNATAETISAATGFDSERVTAALADLATEGMVVCEGTAGAADAGSVYRLP